MGGHIPPYPFGAVRPLRGNGNLRPRCFCYFFSCFILLFFCLHFYPMCITRFGTAGSLIANDPEHRAPKGGIVVHVNSAVERTVARAIASIDAVVAEHPRRGRNRLIFTAACLGKATRTAPTILAITCFIRGTCDCICAVRRTA